MIHSAQRTHRNDESNDQRNARSADLPTSAEPPLAARHFAWKLTFETDPADVWAEQRAGAADLVIVDARSTEAYRTGHIPGAISLPHREIHEQLDLDPTKRYVTYCWGPGCNAATKAAMQLASLGLRVREMIGGLEYWEREGYPIEASTVSESAPI